MADIIINPGESIQAKVNTAGIGDTLILSDGIYPGAVNMTSKTGLTLRAANIGKAIISGGQVRTGPNALKGVVIQKAVTPWWDGALLPGSGSLIEDVLVRDNETIGICLRDCANVVLRRVRSTHNQTLGMNSGVTQASGWCRNITLEGVVVDNNNYGVLNPSWADPGQPIRTVSGFKIFGKVVQAPSPDNRWYRLPGDEGGGVKLTRTDGIKVIGGSYSDNVGPGFWLDVQGNNSEIDSVEAKGNRNIVPGQPWEAPGFAIEISDKAKLTNCYGHDNTGSGFAVWESTNVEILNCYLKDDNIEFRDIDTRGTWRTRNCTVTNLKIYGGGTFGWWGSLDTQAERDAAKIVVTGTQTGLIGIPPWQGGTIPNPEPIPTPKPKVTVTVQKLAALVTDSEVYVKQVQPKIEVEPADSVEVVVKQA